VKSVLRNCGKIPNKQAGRWKHLSRVFRLSVVILHSFEKEEWISDLTKKEKKGIREEYARYSLNKQKRINIRMSERDLKKIRTKAIEEGIPYQSLISMLIHKYSEGKVSINR
jgi:predicted DNA binding CopG/RHH family protein